MASPAAADLAQLLEERFRGRRDVYILQQKGPEGDYRSVRSELTREVLLDHCLGKLTVGVYPLTPQGVHFGVFDIDFKGDRAQELIAAMTAESKKLGLPLLLESSGRKGYHLWLLCQEATDPGLVQYYLRSLLTHSGGSTGVEIFPKQLGGVTLGNAIKLPFGIHRATQQRAIFLDLKSFEPLADWGLELVRTAPGATADRIKSALGTLSGEKESSERKAEKPKHRGLLLCYPKMERGVPQGQRDEVTFRLAVHYYDQGYTGPEALEKLIRVNEKNTPPLEEKILQQKVAQAGTGRFGFGCTNPLIIEFCDANCPIYPKRFKAGFGQDIPPGGVGPEAKEASPEDLPHNLSIIQTRPRYYEAGVKGYRLILTGSELLSLRYFKRRVMDELDFIPKIPMKQSAWEEHIDSLLRQAQKEEAPEATSFTNQMLDLLYEWLESTPAADSYEEAGEGRPIARNGRWYFRGPDITAQFKNRYHVIIGPNRLWAEFVRQIGGGSHRVEVGERWLDLWWVPRRGEVGTEEELKPELKLEDEWSLE